MNIRFLFASSLVLNVVLIAAVVMLPGRRQPSSTGVVPSELAPMATPTVAPPVVAAEAMPVDAKETFRWSQLEASDDATYIRNLRAAGCPESTLRDILTAAIGHRYDEKRAAVEVQRKKEEISAVDRESMVSRLWDEQNELVARLFGMPSGYGSGGVIAKPTQVASANSATSRHSDGPPEQAARLARVGLSGNTAPLAFLEPDPSWRLSESETQIYDQVYDRFAAAVGGEGQNPSDPAYYERWRQAQARADQQLKMLFGANRVSQWQLQSRSRMPPAPAK